MKKIIVVLLVLVFSVPALAQEVAQTVELNFSEPLVIATPGETYLKEIIPFDHPLLEGNVFSSNSVTINSESKNVQDFILLPAAMLGMKNAEKYTEGWLRNALKEWLGYLFIITGVKNATVDVMGPLVDEIGMDTLKPLVGISVDGDVQKVKFKQIELVDVKGAPPVAAVVSDAPYQDHLPFDSLMQTTNGAITPFGGFLGTSTNALVEYIFGEDNALKEKTLNLVTLSDVAAKYWPPVVRECAEGFNNVCFQTVGETTQAALSSATLNIFARSLTRYHKVHFVDFDSDPSTREVPIVLAGGGMSFTPSLVVYNYIDDKIGYERTIEISPDPLDSAVLDKNKIAVTTENGIDIVSAQTKTTLLLTIAESGVRANRLEVKDLNKDGCDDLALTYVKFDGEDTRFQGHRLAKFLPKFSVLIQKKVDSKCMEEFLQLDYSVPPDGNKQAELADIATISTKFDEIYILTGDQKMYEDGARIYAFKINQGIPEINSKTFKVKLDNYSSEMAISRLEVDKFGNVAGILGYPEFKNVSKLVCKGDEAASITKEMAAKLPPEELAAKWPQELGAFGCDMYISCVGDPDGDGVNDELPEQEIKMVDFHGKKVTKYIICDPCPAKVCLDEKKDVSNCSNTANRQSDSHPENLVVDICEQFKCPESSDKFYSPWMAKIKGNDVDHDGIPDFLPTSGVFPQMMTWDIQCDSGISQGTGANVETDNIDEVEGAFNKVINIFTDLLSSDAFAEKVKIETRALAGDRLTKNWAAFIQSIANATDKSADYFQDKASAASYLSGTKNILEDYEQLRSKTFDRIESSSVEIAKALGSRNLAGSEIDVEYSGKQRVSREGQGAAVESQGQTVEPVWVFPNESLDFPASKAFVLINMAGPTKKEEPKEEPKKDEEEAVSSIFEVTVTSCPDQAMYDYVRSLNDEVRAIVGKPIDIFICEFGQYKAVVPIPKDAVSVTPTDKKVGNLYQMAGMPPVNYATFEKRPQKNQRLNKPLKLIPYGVTLSGKSDLQGLVSPYVPDFAYDQLPQGSLVVVSDDENFFQINGVLQVKYQEGILNTGKLETKSEGETKAASPVVVGLHDGIFGADACAWANDSCSETVTMITDRRIDPRVAIEMLKQLKQEWDSQGLFKVTKDPHEDAILISKFYDEWALKADWDVDKFFMAKYQYPTSKNDGVSINLWGVQPPMNAQGTGCGCRMAKFDSSSLLSILFLIIPMSIIWTAVRMRGRKAR